MNKLFFFVLSFLLSFNINYYSFSAENNRNIKTDTIVREGTKGIKKSSNTIRKKKEKKNTGIKALNQKQQVERGAVLLSNRIVNANSPLCIYAIKNDVISFKRSLMKKNYNNSEVNTICKDGETLLMLAVKNDNYLTAKFLIEKGADVNIQNDAGVAPLHILARIDKQNTERIFNMLLVDTRLDKNIKDMEGYTPLMRAVEFEKIDIIDQLLKIGADVNVKNNYGFNAVELAQHNLESQKSEEGREKCEKIVNILMQNV